MAGRLLENPPDALIVAVPFVSIISLVTGIAALVMGRGRVARIEGMVAIAAGLIGLLFIGLLVLVAATTAISYP